MVCYPKPILEDVSVSEKMLIAIVTYCNSVAWKLKRKLRKVEYL